MKYTNKGSYVPSKISKLNKDKYNSKNNGSHNANNSSSSVDPLIFYPAIILVALSAAGMILFPDEAGKVVAAARASIMRNFSSAFMAFGFFSFLAVLWLGFGPYANVVLGGPTAKPEYSKSSWISMLFCAGIGIGIMIWSVVEPIYYLSSPPKGVEPLGEQAFVWAHMLPLYHWGFSAWAIYCLPTIPVAYHVYVRGGKVFRISESARPILGKKTDGFWGKLIELFVLLGTVGAVGTSLGLAIPLISRLLSVILELPDDFLMKFLVALLLFALFGTSVYLGLDKGLKNLTRLNVWGAFLLIGLVLIFGPAAFIFDIWTNSLGLLIHNFSMLSFQTEPLRLLGSDKGAWPQEWTVFYWAWWVAYAPVTALFVASISKGRTIRELVVAECVWGTLGCWIFMAVFGGLSLYLQKSGALDVIAIRETMGDPAACLAVMGALPHKWLIIPLYATMCFVFLATTLQAAAYSLANLCAKKGSGEVEPKRWSRMLWASLIALYGLGILATGGEKALNTVQTSTIVGGTILLPIILILALGLFKALREDFKDRIYKDQL